MARIVTQDCKAPYRATTAMCATLISSGAEGQNAPYKYLLNLLPSFPTTYLRCRSQDR